MSPRARPDTRERLIESARTLFWERSYANAPVADILERAQANSGSFYHHFTSKADLLLAVLDRYVELLPTVILEPAFRSTDDPIERIFAILGVYRAALVETGCDYGCPIGKLSLEIGCEHAEAHHRIAANFASWAAAVRRCLEDAADRLPAGEDLAGLSQFVLSAMEGAVMQARSHRSLEPFDATVSHLRSHFEMLQRRRREERSGDRRPGVAS